MTLQHYVQQSYESRLLYWLHEVHGFFESSRLVYALFGGAAVGGYVGHLPRKLHDIDVVVSPEAVQPFERFLTGRGSHSG